MQILSEHTSMLSPHQRDFISSCLLQLSLREGSYRPDTTLKSRRQMLLLIGKDLIMTLLAMAW